MNDAELMAMAMEVWAEDPDDLMEAWRNGRPANVRIAGKLHIPDHLVADDDPDAIVGPLR